MLARKLLRFATFRGQTRDAQADLQRSNMVWDAIAGALSSLDSEMAGLGRRVEELRGWIGGLVGTDGCEPSCRDIDAEADLTDAERQLLSGLTRLAHLREVRAGYSVVQAAVETERNRALEACRPVHSRSSGRC